MKINLLDRPRFKMIHPVNFVMKNLDVILRILRWMRNNALELMNTILFLGD